MNDLSAGRQWFDDIIDQNKLLLTDSNVEWLNQTRERAREQVATAGVPTRKHEAWRYTSLDHLFNKTYQKQDVPFTALDDGDIETWVYNEEDSYRLVFANGHCVPALSNITVLPDDIKLGSLRAVMSTDPDLVSQWIAKDTTDANAIFKLLNNAFINDGLFLHVPEGVIVDKPIEVVYLNLSFDLNALCQPRSLVILESGAQAKLVERYVSTGDSEYLFNGVNELHLDAHANLQHYRIQDESNKAHHFSHIGLTQNADSQYHAINIATGAAWSRTEFAAQFTGEHAVCDVNGLYTVADKQYTDFHLDVHHNLPNCQSRENFRGIVFGAGRAVFDGKILVEKDAQKTDAQLSNKNLLLVENAEIDTKPQLEIYADDVKCSHGTTVGKIDPNHLFYLRSRGLNKPDAYKMLCLGFAEQTLEQITDERVHDYIQSHIANLLSRQEAVL